MSDQRRYRDEEIGRIFEAAASFSSAESWTEQVAYIPARARLLIANPPEAEP